MTEETKKTKEALSLYLSAKYKRDRMFGPKMAQSIAHYAVEEGWVKPGQTFLLEDICPKPVKRVERAHMNLSALDE